MANLIKKGTSDKERLRELKETEKELRNLVNYWSEDYVKNELQAIDNRIEELKARKLELIKSRLLPRKGKHEIYSRRLSDNLKDQKKIKTSGKELRKLASLQDMIKRLEKQVEERERGLV